MSQLESQQFGGVAVELSKEKPSLEYSTISNKSSVVEKTVHIESKNDPDLVDWHEDDPDNPLNWSTARVWSNLATISFFRFLSPLASTMIAPAAPSILDNFGMQSQTVESFITSIYVLGYAIGPLFLAPLSEIYGRLYIYHINNILFTVWNIGAALSPNVGAVLVFRLLSGLAASCPVSIGNGSVVDCIPKERRGLALNIFIAGPMLAPVAGPVVGGLLSEAVGWRWVFWVLAIVSGVVAVISIIFQRETYGPVLLERRTQRLRTQTGNLDLRHRYSDTFDRPTLLLLTRAITRPTKMLLLSPIVFLTSLYVGLVYGYTYLLFTSFAPLFKGTYQFNNTAVGLTYIGFGIGCLIGIFIIGSTSDRISAYYAKKHGWKPEYRLVPLLPGSLIVPIGLFWYGWSAQARLHWIMPIIGSGLVGFGTLAIYTPVQTYLADAFPLYAASATAANIVFRSFMGAFVPLAGPAMYKSLGQGWGNSVLAGIALVFTPLAWIVYRHGEKIRTAFPVDLT